MGVRVDVSSSVTATHELMQIGEHEVMVHRSGAENDQTIVFLHGGGPGATGWSNWQFALPALGSTYHCLAPDLIGYGESAHPEPAPTDMREWTRMRLRQVIGMLDELGVERATLVGNSLGGALSLHLLVESPDRVERAVLMGTAGGPSSKNPTQEVVKMVTFYSDPSPESLARLYSWFVYDADKFGPQLKSIADDRFELTMRPAVRRSYEAQFSGPLHLALPDSALRRIKQPVLLVHGLQDSVNPLDDSLHFLRLLPNAELFVFPQCGHWTQIEHPEKFHTLVGAFVAGDL